MSYSIDADVRAELESKIAYLERANSELSDVVYRQQLELQTLQSQLRSLLQRFDALAAEERVRAPDEERPPHY